MQQWRFLHHAAWMTKSAAHTIVQSLISSRLGYYNSLLAELPQYLIHKLRKVQNWSARIGTGTINAYYQQHQRTTRLARKSYMLQEKRSKLICMGDCAFSVVEPKYWNELPDDIRNIALPLDIFKRNLKTQYFKITYCREKVQ